MILDMLYSDNTALHLLYSRHLLRRHFHELPCLTVPPLPCLLFPWSLRNAANNNNNSLFSTIISNSYALKPQKLLPLLHVTITIVSKLKIIGGEDIEDGIPYLLNCKF